ncbi:MAG: hypothetical protein IME93_02295 [Proteobacteria bacterium]|nr:hypothetical protein [Pseudomonadota bacterium]
MSTLSLKALTASLLLSSLFLMTAAIAQPMDDQDGGPQFGEGQQSEGKQNGNHPQMRHRGPDMQALAKELGLDESQTKKLQQIMQQHRKKMMSKRQQLRQDRQQQNQDRSSRREQRRAMRKEHRKELLTVLSYEQLYKFEEYMEEHRPRRQRGSGSMQGGQGQDQYRRRQG